MFYSRQLSCYNLGIDDERKNRGSMCLWIENYGKKVSMEIATAVYDYVTQEIEVVHIRILMLCSDNCGGQNKNQFLLSMYMTLIAKGYFGAIIHKF